MWGFARGVIYAFNGQIQTLLGYSYGEIVALNMAYWGAYFFGPLLVGYWVLKYEGFKATFITGLCIYAVVQWLFGRLRSFDPIPGSSSRTSSYPAASRVWRLRRTPSSL
jgi:fucose permease